MDKAEQIQERWQGNGYLRLKSIIAPGGPIPISKSEFYKGVKEGRFPAPLKISPRVSVWSSVSIRTLLAKFEEGDL